MLEEVRLSVCSNDIATNIRGVSREDEDTRVNKEEVTVLVKHMRFPSISSDHQLHGPEEAKNGARVAVEAQNRGDGKS